MSGASIGIVFESILDEPGAESIPEAALSTNSSYATTKNGNAICLTEEQRDW